MEPNVVTLPPTRISVGSESPLPTARAVSQRLDVLLDVARVINSTLELPEVLRHILSQAATILQAESGSVMLRSDDTGDLQVLAALGPRAEHVQGRHLDMGEGIAGWVALHGEPLLLRGTMTDAPFKRVCDRQDVRDALCVPLRIEGQVLGVISVSNRLGGGVFSAEDLELLTALSNHAAIAIRNARSYAKIQRQGDTLERLLTELGRAQEEERGRIALQLHDGPAQTLYAALRNLETARIIASREPDALEEVLAELERGIRASISETRSVMIDLRPLVLDDVGLFSALKQYARQFEQRHGIPASVERAGPDRRLPATVESTFYRMAQEALTNVWKHADATQVRVRLEIRERSCVLQIEDNGKGCDMEQAAAAEGEHFGLRSLRERSELMGGYLTIEEAPGGGTVVRVFVPLD